MSLYDWLAANPELAPLYAAFVIFGVAWVYWSSRKLFRWGASISAGFERGDILPPDDITNEIALFLAVVAADLLLIGAYIYAVT